MGNPALNYLICSILAWNTVSVLAVDEPKFDIAWKFKIQNVLNANEVTFVSTSGSVTLDPTGRTVSGSFPSGSPGRYFFQECDSNFLLHFGSNVIEDTFEFADSTPTIMWFGWESHQAASTYRAASNDPRFLGSPTGYMVVDEAVLRTMLNLTNFEARGVDGRVRVAAFQVGWDLPDSFATNWRLGTTTSSQNPSSHYNVILESFAITIPLP